MQSLEPLFSIVRQHPGWAVAIAGSGLALLLYLWRGRSASAGTGSGQSAGTAPRVGTAPADLFDQVEQLQGRIRTLEAENRQLATIYTLLPSLGRVLTNTTEKREIVPLLGQLLEHQLDPRELFIFLRTRDGEALTLAHTTARSPGIDERLRIVPGQGRIGFVARHQRTLDAQEFGDRARYPLHTEAPVAAIERRLDLCGPIVHGDATLGVIGLVGIQRSQKDAKRIVRMVGDLGGIALINAMNFRDVQLAANCDAMTRLFNRRYLLVRLEEQIERARRTALPFCVFMFDLDHFKHFNDRNGHPAGDQALRTTADLIRQNLRADDIAARYGGEEFLIVLAGSDKPGGLRAADKIRRAIEEHNYQEGQHQPLGKVTISGGVACFPEDERTAEDLIAAADNALYQAKAAGRNRVLLYQAGDALATASSTDDRV